MEWSRKRLRKNAWATVLGRGIAAWLALAFVCFVFSYLGVDDTSQTKFVKSIDEMIGHEDVHDAGNVEILKDYAENAPIVKDIPGITSDEAITAIEALTSSQTWLIKLLGVNSAYIKRNSGEVIVTLLLAAILTTLIHFFIQSAAIVGKCRYAMECRYSDKVSINRIFAPFHRKKLPRLMIDMFYYNIILTLWTLTIVGGIVKYYQYRMAPYVLAENPDLKWREARDISKRMTKGCKWKMFLTDLSCIPVKLLKAVPVAGIMLAVPFEVELDTEMYFWFRKRLGDAEFPERAFDAEPYTQTKGTQSFVQPVYVLKDVAVEVPAGMKVKSEYGLKDFVFFFFVFCFIGWAWEVSLHIVRDHVLVNRGTMYGPWLPVYGVGGVAIIFLLDRFKANKAKFFFMAIAVCAVIEFAASWILDFFFNSHYWNYKNDFMNVNGRICFASLMAFGIGSLFGVYVAAPKLSGFLRARSTRTQLVICVGLVALFVADIICCMIFGFNKGSGVGGTY